ncbi:hypothetical protein [Treponema socranskii]|uniref:hypothetical protein n=1 Tax=Treponema socranskii TaxID=53419 RepID=UPI003D6E85AD
MNVKKNIIIVVVCAFGCIIVSAGITIGIQQHIIRQYRTELAFVRDGERDAAAAGAELERRLAEGARIAGELTESIGRSAGTIQDLRKQIAEVRSYVERLENCLHIDNDKHTDCGSNDDIVSKSS